MDPTVFPLPQDELNSSSIYFYNTTNPLSEEETDIVTTFPPIYFQSTTSIIMNHIDNASQKLLDSLHSDGIKGSTTTTTEIVPTVVGGDTDTEVVPAEAAIGICLALLANCLIAVSVILKKQSLKQLQERGAVRASEGGLGYLTAQRWWSGLMLMSLGEILNFVAYIFAPAILVTPLAVFAIVINAALSPFFLKETLGGLGRVGCLLTLVGCLIVTLCGPKDQEITTMEQLDTYLSSAPFLINSGILVGITIVLMILSPKYGRNNILFEVFIVGCLGSMSVILCKGIGLGLKTTIEGTENSFTRLSFWICTFILVLFLTVELVYSQRALDKFNSTILMSSIYVVFVSLVILNSSVSFPETSNIGWKNIVLTISGFLVNIAALYILNVDMNPTLQTAKTEEDRIPSDSQLQVVSNDSKEVVRQLYELRRESKTGSFSTLPSHTPMPTPLKVPSMGSCTLPNIATAMFRENAESNSCLSLISESPSSKINYNNKDSHSYDSTDTNSSQSSCSGGNEINNLQFKTFGNEGGHCNSSGRSSFSERSAEKKEIRSGEKQKEPKELQKLNCRSPSTPNIECYKPSSSTSVPDARDSQGYKLDMRNAYSEGNGIDINITDNSRSYQMPEKNDVEC